MKLSSAFLYLIMPTGLSFGQPSIDNKKGFGEEVTGRREDIRNYLTNKGYRIRSKHTTAFHFLPCKLHSCYQKNKNRPAKYRYGFHWSTSYYHSDIARSCTTPVHNRK